MYYPDVREEYQTAGFIACTISFRFFVSVEAECHLKDWTAFTRAP